jgi:hypothetical protein
MNPTEEKRMQQVCDTPAAAMAGKAKQVTPFGYQLLLDLYDCKKGTADDLGLCYEFLEQIVKVLKVEPQSPPFIFRTDGSRYPDKAGLSGWIPLVESGIQIHSSKSSRLRSSSTRTFLPKRWTSSSLSAASTTTSPKTTLAL